MTIDELSILLTRAWTAETSSDPSGWTSKNPAHGQCAVSALVVQDAFGGDLLRAIVRGVSHYWNRLPCGHECDLTRRQFDLGVEIPSGDARPRSYVLSFPDTAKRYEILRAAVQCHTLRAALHGGEAREGQ